MQIDNFKPEEVEWCEICRPHVDGKCDGCALEFESIDAKYRSQSHHFHPGSVAGVPGILAIHKTLCVDCYRKDHAQVHPHARVPELPDRGMDPNFFQQLRIQKGKKRVIELLKKDQSDLTPEESLEVQAFIDKAAV